VEDELIRKYLPPALQKTLNSAFRREFRAKDRVANAAFKLAQRKAQSLAFKQRKSVLRSDIWLDEALSFAGGEAI
jgi:preprotein translocase subunit SecA